MKFSTLSGSSLVSSEHDPGLGSGTSLLGTGNHMDVEEACSLNLPSSKALLMALNWKEQMADPFRPF